MTATAPDEFDALRTITKSLEGFGVEDQARILRWVSEKLGIGSAAVPHVAPAGAPSNLNSPPVVASEAAGSQGQSLSDIKSFVANKKPKNDMQFAAVVAYFFRFEATEKKESITAADLLDACRLANYNRPPAPRQTLRNAVNAGLLDKGDRGEFIINSVGENLVAVTLPGDGSAADAPARMRRKRTKKGAAKKAAAKPTSKKAAAKKQ